MVAHASSKTGHPIFIGYSEFSSNQNQSLHPVAQLIYSLDEFDSFFGGPAPAAITVQLNKQSELESYRIRKNFLLYDSVKLFFANGGTSCHIISVGGYKQPITMGKLLSGLVAVKSGQKSNLLLVPDAISIADAPRKQESFQALQQALLTHCAKQENLFALLDRQQDPTNPKHNKQTHDKQVDEASTSHRIIDSPWVKTTLSTAIRLRDLKLEQAGAPLSLNTIAASAEQSELLNELKTAISNAKRITKSIKRRQQQEPSLTECFKILLADYLSQPPLSKENLPLQRLLQFLKQLAEMINNWICACTLDEVLSGDMLEIIRQTIIPEIATRGLPDLIKLHQQTIVEGWVDTPSISYKEMFCLTSCMGNNCPWQQNSESTASITLSKNPAENQPILLTIFECFEEAISVVVELAEQFEGDAQENLLQQSPVLRTIITTLQQSRYIPPSVTLISI